MGGGIESGRTPKRRIDDEAKACFLKGLRAGLGRDAAAKAAGFSSTAFYYARDRDPVFALAYAWAVDLSAADAHAARAVAALPGTGQITPTGGRRLQRRTIRRARFDDRRKRLFLDHFAGTADARAACVAAGICYSTYTQHRRKDPEFAAGCAEALAIAYADMEAESVRTRLEAQRNLRDGICPAGEAAKEFDRQMKLLERHERKGGGIGVRSVAHGGQQRASFQDFLAAADRKLRALGARHGIQADPIRPDPREEPEDGGN
jgi:hypothetical protein